MLMNMCTPIPSPPPSASPQCGHAIRRRDAVAVLGTALLVALVAVLALPQQSGAPRATAAGVLVIAALLFLMVVSVSLALIDLDTHTLPNAIVHPAAVVLLVLLGGASVADGDLAPFVRGLIGAAVLGSTYLLLAVAVPGGLGFGDVKLAVVLGLVLAYLGWGPLAVGALGAFLVGGTAAVVLLVLGRTHRKGGIPFGPSMLIGAWLGIAVGAPLWQGYLGLLGLT
jgi:leader peptidase (prepilin peptidase)/N-methyltransferase